MLDRTNHKLNESPKGWGVFIYPETDGLFSSTDEVPYPDDDIDRTTEDPTLDAMANVRRERNHTKSSYSTRQPRNKGMKWPVKTRKATQCPKITSRIAKNKRQLRRRRLRAQKLKEQVSWWRTEPNKDLFTNTLDALADIQR